MIKNLLFGLFTILLVSSCKVGEQSVYSKSEKRDLEYYNAFTEATKHALLGNLKSAITLYDVCIANYPEKAAPYYQASNIYLSVKEFNKAKEYAKIAVEKEKNNKWYLLHLANIYHFENNVDSIIPIYERVVKLTDNAEYKYNLAAYYTKKGEIKKSMVLLNELESEYYGMREIILMKHQNYSALNERDSAVYQLKTLIKLFPDESTNYGLLAEYLSEINRYERAQIIYKDLLKVDSDNGLANISYGDFFIKQGKKDSALIYYKKGFECEDIKIEDKIGILFNYIYDPVAIKSDTVFIENLIGKLIEEHPSDSRSYTLAAEYNVKRQKYDKALEELGNAIKYNAEAYVIWEQYIMISNFLKKYENIESIYKNALDKFPEQAKLYIFSAYGLYALEKHNEAIKVSENALKYAQLTKEDSVQALNQIADSYRGLERFDESDSIYEDILKIDPENLLIRNNYSYYLSVRNKNLDRAEELSRFTIKKEPKNSTYLDTYGWILFMKGEYRDALKYIESAIKNGAYKNSEVLEHYGDVSLKLDRCKDAIEAWNEAIKHDIKRKEELETKISVASENCK